MELFSHPLVAIVLLIGILIFVHELGHFIVGKLCGVGVETFSIGFGPPIVKYERQGTVYQLAWIPLGGYVKFAGFIPSDKVAEMHRGKEMYLASKKKRFFIIAAGPAANFLLAFVIYTILGMAGIKHAPAIIGTVRPDSPAYASGLRSGDKVIAIDGDEVSKWEELHHKIVRSPQQKLLFTVLRQEQKIDLLLVPEDIDGRGRAGIGLDYEKAIVTVKDASLAAKYGLQTGDEILAVQVDGKKTNIKTFTQLQDLFPLPAVQEGVFHLHVKRKDSEEGVFIPYTQEQSLVALGILSSMLTIKKAELPAANSLIPYDHILAVQNKPVRDIYALYDILKKHKQPQVEMTVARSGKEVTLDVELKPHIVQKPEGSVTVYALPATFVGKMYSPEPLFEQYTNPLQAVLFGVTETAQKSAMILVSLFGLFTGDVPLKALGGPILIAKVAGDSAKAGWKIFLTTMALISINLGLINLFPIPVLDGGQLLMVGMEFVRRRRLTMETIENFQRVGFAMVMCLLVLATYNDLSRFWQSFLKTIMGFFE